MSTLAVSVLALGAAAAGSAALYGKRGCVVAPKKSIRAVANHPGNYYVNVHTRQYLNGALRGQLRKNGRA